MVVSIKAFSRTPQPAEAEAAQEAEQAISREPRPYKNAEDLANRPNLMLRLCYFLNLMCLYATDVAPNHPRLHALSLYDLAFVGIFIACDSRVEDRSKVCATAVPSHLVS